MLLSRYTKTLCCTLCAMIIWLPAVSLQAQTHDQFDQTVLRMAVEGWRYQLRAGFNLGGMAPIPMPRQIRAINSYNPTLAFSVEGRAEKIIDNTNFGVVLGLKLEQKGMKTDARVQHYHMEMTAEEGGYIEGVWTGNVKTKVRNAYLTIPLLLAYHCSPRVMLSAGPYFSYRLGSDFTGAAYDGYLRKTDPTGERTIIKSAQYDFSNKIRKYNWGLQIGGEWRAYSRFSVFADLTCGLGDIFPDGFDSITFPLYPIYLNAGFAYTF